MGLCRGSIVEEMIVFYLCKICVIYCNVIMVEYLCVEVKKKFMSLLNEVLYYSIFEKVVIIFVEFKVVCIFNE